MSCGISIQACPAVTVTVQRKAKKLNMMIKRFIDRKLTLKSQEFNNKIFKIHGMKKHFEKTYKNASEGVTLVLIKRENAYTRYSYRTRSRSNRISYSTLTAQKSSKTSSFLPLRYILGMQMYGICTSGCKSQSSILLFVNCPI